MRWNIFKEKKIVVLIFTIPEKLISIMHTQKLDTVLKEFENRIALSFERKN